MKLDIDGVMTLKNIELIDNDFLAKITTLEQEINVIQQSMGVFTQDIGDMQQYIDVINTELARQTHFRGYYLLNADIQALDNCANGDFAFSAQSGTVWMYDTNWYDSGQLVPDQVTPASDANPLNDYDTGVAGISTNYSRGDHQHPLNIDSDTSKVPLVNATAASNGTSDYYCRNDHVHPEQLTYGGNLTATSFNKSGATSTDILCGDGTTSSLSNLVTIDSVQTIIGGKTFKNNQLQIQNPNGNPLVVFNNNNGYCEQLTNSNELNLSMNYSGTSPVLYINYRDTNLTSQFPNAKTVNTFVLNAGSSTTYAQVISGNIQLNPTSAAYGAGLRISRSLSTTGEVGTSEIQLGCSRTSTSGVIAGQWIVFTRPASYTNNPLGFTIALSNQAGDNNKGLQISADGNTLSFNGSVIAGTGATTGATNGSVTYSEGNPILWGTNNAGTEGGFYSDGANVYWRARKVNVASVSP
ncbi:MAG: hypothetical protein EZS28_013567 [Streblomastix strix]|uniref:Uncharacterized protein n=1 Tax=Streblomastix strix TaxID=222440 RepID=A0A5J4W992_9EUKA|nr:MAG: hypothetical protein EZS28_013567 [Streblomastix strix]